MKSLLQRRISDALADVSITYPVDNAMQHEADVFGFEIDAAAQAMQGANQHEWNQAVDNEVAAQEGAGFEFD